jgi:exosortase K
VLKPSTALAGGAGVAFAAALKAFYGHAGPDQLLWILAPASWLARYAGGVDLAYERGGGFISHTHHLVVGAACAGVNFLVIAFLTLLLGFLPRFGSPARRLAWVPAALGLAYAATVVTNGLRIVLAAHLYELDIYGDVVTPERVHRLAGTVIYYGSLLALYLAVEALVRARGDRPAAWTRLVPLGCYLLVSVAVPLAGRACSYAGTRRLGEHVASVAGVAVVLTLLAVLPKRLVRDGIQWRT